MRELETGGAFCLSAKRYFFSYGTQDAISVLEFSMVLRPGESFDSLYKVIFLQSELHS